jgi:phosphoglucosamine mutase
LTAVSTKSVSAPAPVQRHLFGTDGIRGVANSELTPLMALSLGAAAAHVLLEARHGERCRVVVGRDPRISGDLLGAALMAGFCSQGVDVLDVGVIPTPGVAYLTRTTGASAGVVISASHNPLQDNGIKFFGPNGKKLADAVEARIEAAMATWESLPRPSGAGVGKISASREPVGDYADHLVEICGGVRLDGLRLAIDAANGSASYLAGPLFERLGAEVHLLSATPDGLNINADCGSLHPEHLAAETLRLGCDAGLAFDGDADRVILVDGKGRIFDGDRILATAGIYLKSRGALPGNVIVGTVMSNLGLEQTLTRHGVTLVRAQVGDRYVSEQMTEHGAVVGGEKSGHILFTQLTTTGDGVLTALQMLCICHESGRSLADWADEMQELPQKLVNIRVRQREGWQAVPSVAAALQAAEECLKGRGRIFVRPSGTEKMIRVMAEGPDADEVDRLVGSVADEIRQHLGE